jgi:hypothetical protein
MTSRTRIVLSLAAIIAPLLIAPYVDVALRWPQAFAQNPQTLKANEEAIRLNMLNISRQLNVTCSTCHHPENFKLGDKVPFKVAKEHIRLTQMLIDNGMDGKNGNPKADCFMCHKGAIKPDYKEKIDPMQK